MMILKGLVQRGHGVASGRSNQSPYPVGSIQMQQPFFAAAGINLHNCWPGTINLSFSPFEVRLTHPDHCIKQLHWTDLHPPETFSFWKILLRFRDSEDIPGWIYRPHPETKQRHWQPDTMVELLAPYLEGVQTGDYIEIMDPQNRLQLVDSVRLRVQLLEFLKFRVLASQEQFFMETSGLSKREWLFNMAPQFLALSDIDLDSVWDQARNLYTES